MMRPSCLEGTEVFTENEVFLVGAKIDLDNKLKLKI